MGDDLNTGIGLAVLTLVARGVRGGYVECLIKAVTCASLLKPAVAGVCCFAGLSNRWAGLCFAVSLVDLYAARPGAWLL